MLIDSNRRSLLVDVARAASFMAAGLIAGLDPLPVQADAGKPAIGTWGFDLTAMDRSIAPGDDFFRYVSGTWAKTTKIPPDRSRWGSFDILVAKSEEDVRAVIEAAASGSLASGSVARKVVDRYRSYLDTDAIERLGLDPVRKDLARIDSLETHDDIARLIASPDFRAMSPIGIGVGLDAKHPDAWIVSIVQSGLGMPDRDYYLKPDARFAETRTKYRAYIETMLKLGGVTDAASAADSIFALETRIAELHWPREKSRNRDLTYNRKSRAELESFAPQFPWGVAFDSFGARTQDTFIVAQSDAVQGLANLFRETPVATWRAYLTFHWLDGMAEVLPKALDDAAFEFNGRVLTGQAVQRERWKRAVGGMGVRGFNAPLGEAVGPLYVERYFMPQAKTAMAKLVENLRAAYRERIAKLPWMTEETKRAALRKLETMRVKIGYPDQWRDYGPLDIVAGDAYGNRKREFAFNRARDIARLSKPANRGDWAMAPQTVNAYYNPIWNEIVFPAAILQPPFFDPNADDAVNYGAIGAVIGHEMGHGFDDQGAKSDENGILQKWWNAQDEESFRALTDKLAVQYSKFEALPGLFVNGRLTLGENIGDLGGLNVALEAYKISLGGKPAPVIDGFTGVQRFYLGFGQIWRDLVRDEAMRNQVVSDPHSPDEFRANGTVRNMDEWYEAFGIREGAKLYLAPDQRVRIW